MKLTNSIAQPTPATHPADEAIDRRLRPRACHLGSYFKRPKSSLVCQLACNWYYCAQFIAKPKAGCALRFSWAASSINLGFVSKYDIIRKTGST